MIVTLRSAVFIVACLSLVGCGGEESTQEQTATAESESSAVDTAPKQSNNLFAKEQQLIRDAKGIQAILDEDARKKKEALKNID